MTKKKILLPSATLLVAGAVVVAVVLLQEREEGDAIRVSGTIEATEVALGFPLPGVVETRAVSAGDRVEAGDVVARLDDEELRHEVALRRAALALLEAGARAQEVAKAEAAVKAVEARLSEALAGARPQEVARARAGVRAAKAQLKALEAGSRPQEIATAEAAVEAAEAEVDRRDADLRRMQELHEAEAATARSLEAARTARTAAKARLTEAEKRLSLVREGPREEAVEQARAALEETEQALALVKEGPRQERIEALEAEREQARQALALVKAGPRQERIDQARALLKLAETKRKRARLASPVSGLVLAEGAEEGEFVSPGTPVVTVGDLGNVWLRAYLEETDLGRVKPGMRVEITTDTYPGKVYQGRVTFIASEAEFTPKNVQTRKERVKLVYRIKVAVENPAMELKPGMPADGRILTGDREP